MARAFICDRCGEFHVINSGRSVVEIKRFEKGIILSDCKSYEICMDCMDKLIKFMEEKNESTHK